MIVNFFDSNINHVSSYDDSLERGRIYSGIQYSREYDPSRVSVFTDKRIGDVNNNPGLLNVAWLMEPIAYYPDPYRVLRENSEKFDLILTHNLDVIDAHSNARFIPADGIFLDTESITKKQHHKSRICSHIFSGKTHLMGHRLRHDVASLISSNGLSVDMFGQGTGTWLDKKSDALNEYLFSIAIENSRSRGYFTEKILDCFATRTIPIYWGDNVVWQLFDPRGAICFDEVSQLPSILAGLSLDSYIEKQHYVEANWKHCIDNFYSIDMYVADNIREKLSERGF